MTRMSAVEPLWKILQIDTSNLTKNEIILFEAELFNSVCDELNDFFGSLYKNYFYLINLSKEKENSMREDIFAGQIVKDILSTESYNLTGIAYYANTHEEVIEEIISGRNTSPSAKLLRKLIELHRTVREELYDAIRKKILSRYLPHDSNPISTHYCT